MTCRLDDDGLLDSESLSQHPWSSSGKQRQRYKEVGETGFVQEKAAIARGAIMQHPLDFLQRVANRATAVLVYFVPLRQVDEYNGGGWPILWVRVIHPLPLIALGCIVLFNPVPLASRVKITMIFFGLLVAPYILISYYDRYAAMLVGLKTLMVLYAYSGACSKKGI